MKSSLKSKSIYVFGVLYIAIGLYHFINPDFFLQIMPPYLHWHLELVYISGAAEILLGMGLMYPKTRKISAYGIIALLLAVFPANIYMAFNKDLLVQMNMSPFVAQFIRLPFQFILIGIAYWLRKD